MGFMLARLLKDGMIAAWNVPCAVLCFSRRDMIITSFVLAWFDVGKVSPECRGVLRSLPAAQQGKTKP